MTVKTIRLVQDFLADQSVRQPGKTALICESRRLTYSQIDDQSSRLAHALHHHGVREGDRVLFYLLNGVELAVGIFAALKANAIFVGVDSNNTYETLRAIAADCAITALVTYDHRADAATRLRADVPSLRFAVLTGEKTEGLPAGLLSFDAQLAGHPPEPPSPRRIDADLAYLIYTSGSTGRSKGVMVPHRSIVATIQSGIEYLGLTEADVQVSPMQLSFSPGINQLFQVIRAGGTLILERSLAFPVATLKRMEAERATGFSGVPTMLTLLSKMDLARFDLSRLRYLSSVGASLPLSLIEELGRKLPGASIYSYYGLAEASYALGLDPAQISLRPTSVGKPFPGTQAWIEDEAGLRLGPGRTGELVLRGFNVRAGYWNDPDASALRFSPGPFAGERVCRTGDQFRQDEEGYFHFLSRSDEIIKSGAKKVVPKEIENALYGLDGVLEAAAVGVPDPVLGHAIKAFVVPTEAARPTLTADVALRHCKKVLEDYKVPRDLEIRDSLPKTPSGKILKTSLT